MVKTKVRVATNRLRPSALLSVLMKSGRLICNLFALARLLLGDAGFLTREAAEIVELGATHLTNLVDGDAVDVRACDGEDALYAYGAAHLANRETLLVAVTADLDDYAAVQLDTLLVTLDNLVSYSDGVTSLELGIGFARYATPERLASADLIICMEHFQLVEVLKRLPYAQWNRHRFNEQSDLADPTGDTDSMYRYAFNRIEAGCEVLVAKMAKYR